MIRAFRILTYKNDVPCCASPFVFTRKEADRRILAARTQGKEREKKKRVGATFRMVEALQYFPEELFVKSFKTAKELKYVLFLESKYKTKEVKEPIPGVSEKWTHKGRTMKEQISNWLRKRA